MKDKFTSNSLLASDTINLEYSKVQDLVAKIIAPNESKLVFSIFETFKKKDDKGNNWILKIPNIKSKKPILKGSVVFKSKFESYSGNPIKDPTWKEILIEANNAANGDHVYLESFEVDKVKDGITYVEMWFGS